MSNIGERTKNTTRNIFFGLINKLIILLLPFAIRTIIIYKLGANYVGIGSLFTSILQVLSVTELGFASAITFSMYGPVAKNDIESIIKSVALLRTIYKIVGIIILIVGICVLPFLHFFIKGDVPVDINIYLLYGIYLANTIISYFAFGYKNSILSVYQRYDVINKVNSITEIVKGIIQIIVLLTIENYYVYILMLPVFSFITNLIINKVSNKMFSELAVKMKLTLEGLKDISKQIGGVAIGRISLVCRNSFDSIIISSLLGLVVTAMYSNYYMIFSAITGFLSVLLVSMAASVGNSLSSESIEKNEDDHRKFDFYYMVLTSFCSICLLCLYQPFMKLWVGDDLMFPPTTMVLFCIYFYINHLSQVRSVYSEAAGLWWHFKYLSITEMILNLILNIGLGIWIGVNGILIATIVTAFLFSFIGCSIITYKKLFKASIKRYFINNSLYVLITIVGAVGLYFAIKLINIESWGGFTIKGLVVIFSTVIYLALIYTLIPFTRRYTRSILDKFIFRKTSNRS